MVNYPIIFGVLCIPGGVGILPSTVLVKGLLTIGFPLMRPAIRFYQPTKNPGRPPEISSWNF